MKNRCECELFVEKYFDLPETIKESDKIATDFGQLVNMLAMFRDELKKPKKEKNPCYPAFVEVWCREFPELGFDAVSGVKIKSLIKKTKARLAIGGKEQTVEAAVAAFEYVIAYVKRDHHWCDGKDISTFDQKYLSIIMEIKNGKSTEKKQSARDYINSFKQGNPNF